MISSLKTIQTKPQDNQKHQTETERQTKNQASDKNFFITHPGSILGRTSQQQVEVLVRFILIRTNITISKLSF